MPRAPPVVVRFTDVAEFTGELARDPDLVERRIVRLAQEARAAQGGAFHHLLVHAGAVIEGQLICLTPTPASTGRARAGDQEGVREGARAERADRHRLRGGRARDPPRRLRGQLR